MSNKQPQVQILKGQKVIEETVQLIKKMQFWSNGGAFAEGEHVAISVDPRWSEDKETIQILLTCYAFRHRQVDWKGLPVFILPETGRSVSAIMFLNARGQAVASNLPPGKYRLSTSLKYGITQTKVLAPQQTLRVVRVGSMKKMPDSSRQDESVEVSIYPDEAIVTFQTSDHTLARVTMYMAILGQTSGTVEKSAKVELKPAKENQLLWEGRWKAPMELSKQYNLVWLLWPER